MASGTASDTKTALAELPGQAVVKDTEQATPLTEVEKSKGPKPENGADGEKKGKVGEGQEKESASDKNDPRNSLNGVEKGQDKTSDQANSQDAFLCGVAVSVYQNSGDPNSNWAWFEKQKAAYVNLNLRASAGDLPYFDDAEAEADNGRIETNIKRLGPSIIVKNSRIGKASDFWGRYKEDIKLAKDLGCNSFRISIEWSRLYPKRGQLDENAVKRYHAIFDEMDRVGIAPNVTLHWFVHPRWFDEIGGFTKYENVDVFVEWAKKAFELFGKRAKLWATFNEIGVAAMCGWITGNHPPGKLLRFRTAAHVMRNMLISHARAYEAIKSMPGGKDVEVGVVHNVFWTEPKGHGPFHGHVRAAVAFGNRVWGNETIMRFLKTGVFHHWVPFGRAIHYEDPDGKPGCDWFGVNHYSRGVVDWKLTPNVKKGQELTDMGYPIYPPSLYRACSYAAGLGVPIYVMENGMPSKVDDELRKKWITGCLDQVEKMVEDGIDIRGFMYWTLVDNFEWNFAWELKFGLYEWTPEGPDRKLRKNAAIIKDIYKELPAKIEKSISKQKGRGKERSVDEQLEMELKSEKEYLKNVLQIEDSEIRDLLPLTKDPVTAGVKKPNGVQRCTEL